MNKKIILGSSSPRRIQLLKDILGIEPEVRIPNIDEHIYHEIEVRNVASELALNKFKSLCIQFPLQPNEILITADTTVVLNEQIIDKPKNIQEAKFVLNSLSNNSHEVITGVCIGNHKDYHVFSEKTMVKFGNLRSEDIDYYVKNGQPLDKAGGYGIQEWIGQIGVERIDGCFYNVMGFPVHKIYKSLKLFLT
jgi:septum formation protein